MYSLNSRQPRYRTHTTSLSDDELLIMDALFDYGKFGRNLVQKWFGVQNNMPNKRKTERGGELFVNSRDFSHKATAMHDFSGS